MEKYLIDRKEQILILKVLNNIPDKQMPNNLSKEEQEDWLNSKNFYKCLQLAFTNYFTGHHYLEGITFDENSISLTKLKKFFDFKFRKYLHLYNILNFGWSNIEATFKDVIFPLKTPGKAWEYIIRDEAKYRESNPIKRTPPKKLYRIWLTHKKIIAKEPISEEKIKLFEQFIKEVQRKNKNQFPTYLIYLNIFLGACEVSKDEIVLNELNQYTIVDRELIDLVAKNLQYVSS
jgi:hypothetical protein